MLVSVDLYDALAYKERLFDVSLIIYPSKAQELSIVIDNKFVLKMIDGVCACDGQITKLTPKNRIL